MNRQSGMSSEEMLAHFCKDEEFARAWALEVPKIALAVNVSKLRFERGLTRQQLAEAAGMRQTRIAELERGDGNPRLETLTRIANALRVDVAALLSRHDHDDSVAAPDSGTRRFG